MSARPLYLDAGRRWEVALDERALEVRCEGRAPVRFPLSRLSRVVSHRDAQWQTEALLGCLEAGVPVAFLNARGEPVGWCFGPRRKETSLASLLREGLAHPEWDDRYGSWRSGAERREILGALMACRLHRREPTAVDARAALFNLHRRRFGVPMGPHFRAIRAALHGVVISDLAKAFSDPALVAYARPGLHFGIEFVALLEWSAHLGLVRTPFNEVRENKPLEFAARFVELRSEIFASHFGRLVGSFERQLRDWLL